MKIAILISALYKYYYYYYYWFETEVVIFMFKCHKNLITTGIYIFLCIQQGGQCDFSAWKTENCFSLTSEQICVTFFKRSRISISYGEIYQVIMEDSKFSNIIGSLISKDDGKFMFFEICHSYSMLLNVSNVGEFL